MTIHHMASQLQNSLKSQTRKSCGADQPSQRPRHIDGSRHSRGSWGDKTEAAPKWTAAWLDVESATPFRSRRGGFSRGRGADPLTEATEVLQGCRAAWVALHCAGATAGQLCSPRAPIVLPDRLALLTRHDVGTARARVPGGKRGQKGALPAQLMDCSCRTSRLGEASFRDVDQYLAPRMRGKCLFCALSRVLGTSTRHMIHQVFVVVYLCL